MAAGAATTTTGSSLGEVSGQLRSALDGAGDHLGAVIEAVGEGISAKGGAGHEGLDILVHVGAEFSLGVEVSHVLVVRHGFRITGGESTSLGDECDVVVIAYGASTRGGFSSILTGHLIL